MNTCSFVRIYHNEKCKEICNCIGLNLPPNEENGSRIKEEYFQNNNIKEGIYKQYYSNGQLLAECNYINGKKVGKYIKYYYNGQKLLECYYINNKIDGYLKIYKSNGDLFIK